MGVRYTKGPIKYATTIRSDTAAHMIADIDAVLRPCALARAASTGGWKYTLQSPDGLQMKVWIQDLGDSTVSNSYLRITPTSADELRAGPYQLQILSGITYEGLADMCQFFMAPLGDSVGNWDYTFACGVLALAPTESGPCAAGSLSVTVTELWWSSGGNGGRGFRSGRTAVNEYALCYNGSLSAGGTLQLVPLCAASNVDWPYGSPASIVKYNSGSGFRIDALLAQDITVYGQLWDAHLYTLPATLDSTAALTDTDADGNTISSNWLVWNNYVPSSPNGGKGTVLATLFLLLASPAGSSITNVAY